MQPGSTDVASVADGRILAFEGIANFRDYGGYAASGGRLRRGVLFRSAQHRDATEADLARISALSLVGVIDLRGGTERAKAPCPRPPGFSARVYHVSEETGGLMAPHIEAARGVGEGFDAVRIMSQTYASMPFRQRLKAAFANYFEALDVIDGATLVHCAAGKDRTGLAVALLHSALGVHRDDVVTDYLLTNHAVDVAARVATDGAYMRQTYGLEIAEDQMRELVLVSPRYMEAAMTAIADRHGDVRGYLSEHLGVSEARLDRIRERLVE